MYDEMENTSTCQVLSMTDSDNSDICGHKIMGKFPSNLKLHLKKHHAESYSDLVRDEEKEKKQRAKGKSQANSISKNQPAVDSGPVLAMWYSL